MMSYNYSSHSIGCACVTVGVATEDNIIQEDLRYCSLPHLHSFISACCASSTITVHSTHVDLSLLRLLSVLFKTSMKVHEELSGSSPRQISVRGNSPTMAQNHDSRLAHLVVLIQY